MHLPPLIQDLAFMLMTAAVTTLIFRKFNQPLVLGYLFAGFLVGPHFTLTPALTDLDSIQVWADIGVIFLLFSLGLEFSFKKLFQVGKTASVTAVFEVTLMLTLGYLLGRVFGWSKLDALFLGGIMSISSTTIIVRAVEELGLKGRRFVSVVFGVLIVEDLVAVLLLVLLSTVAASQTLNETDLAMQALRLGFFLVLWFVLGIYLLPQFLNKARSLLTNETLLVIAIGLCLMMVFLASKAGFSAALGAFVMGSLLAETKEGERIEHILQPVRHLFSAVFFVSVGMLIDPSVIVENWQAVLAISAAVIMGKMLFASTGALISGQSIRHSLQAGMSLTQIGEFSFIIATLGVTLGVTRSSLYPIAVAVSAVTTFSTPYMIRLSLPLSKWMENILPLKTRGRFEQYQAILQSRKGEGPIALIWNAYGIKWLLNSVMVVALGTGFKYFLLPNVQTFLSSSRRASLLTLAVALVCSAPFFWSIVLGGPSKRVQKPKQFEMLRKLQIGTLLLRFTIGFMLFVFLFSRFASLKTTSGVLLGLIAVITAVVSRYAEPFYLYFENRFIKNLNAKDYEKDTLAPWDATLTEMRLSPFSEFVGRTLMESALKEKFGVTVALIERGARKILAPGRDEMLFPEDKLFLIGTDEQLAVARTSIEVAMPKNHSDGLESYGLEPLILNDDSPFVHKSIRDCGLREEVQGLIVGIERNGQRILNPDSSLALKPQDLVWIVGNQQLVRKLHKAL